MKGPGLPGVLSECVSYVAKQNGIPLAKPSLMLFLPQLPEQCALTFLDMVVLGQACGRKGGQGPARGSYWRFTTAFLHPWGCVFLLFSPCVHHPIILQKIRIISSRDCVFNQVIFTFSIHFVTQLMVTISPTLTYCLLTRENVCST